MYRADDVRIENIPDATIVNPTDAVIRITRACICGSDLWPYNELEQPTPAGRRMGHEAIGVVESIGADVRILKGGDVIVMPSRTPTAPACSAMTACKHRASVAIFLGGARSAEPKPRPCLSLRLVERSLLCRSAPTMP